MFVHPSLANSALRAVSFSVWPDNSTEVSNADRLFSQQRNNRILVGMMLGHSVNLF